MACQASKVVVNRNSFVTAGSVSDMPLATEKAARTGGFLPSATPLIRSETKLSHSCCGVPGRIRTRDPLLRRQPLCPLSYWDFGTFLRPNRIGYHTILQESLVALSRQIWGVIVDESLRGHELKFARMPSLWQNTSDHIHILAKGVLADG